MTDLTLDEYKIFIDLLATGVHHDLVRKKSDKKKIRPYASTAFDDAVHNRLVSLIGEYEYVKGNKNRFPENKIHPGGWFIPYQDKENPINSEGCFLFFCEAIDEEVDKYLKTIKKFYLGNIFVLRSRDVEFKSYSIEEISSLVSCYQFVDGNYIHFNLEDVFQGYTKKKLYKKEVLTDGQYNHLVEMHGVFKAYRKEMLHSFFERLIIDHYMFAQYKRGTLSDIDFVLWAKNKPYYIDVKRKYADENSHFGINEKHLPFFMHLEESSEGESAYVVVVYDKETGKTIDIKRTPMRNFFESSYRAGGAGGYQVTDLRTKGVPSSEMKSIYES
ncbi:hypothetical protein BGP77_11575 [Saccharospirillum sp. MSK14-1]|uniref:hypothetical protein n=1 Tax=Saccharospirillum sp. MSK14-1 TaxID=1897632 RepID=UPI000D3975AC|nr:hypothetical protein [Saccharospirillum sp. MSK14-1]PTY38578.1 hypothetical protein BGP77_11575 [Saccharospirillum sp. MSK14-1]